MSIYLFEDIIHMENSPCKREDIILDWQKYAKGYSLVAVDKDGHRIASLARFEPNRSAVSFVSAKGCLDEAGVDTSVFSWDKRGALVVDEADMF